MRSGLLLFATTALMIVTLCAQENSNQKSPHFTASVVSVSGVCYVRDDKNSSPRTLKDGDTLCAGQQLSCDKNGELKIIFSASKAEKVIKKVRPNWYIIPRVPSKIDPLSRAGRPKGDDCKKEPSN